MNQGFTFTIEVFTPALLCTGSYTLPLYRRVSDALNNRLSRFITLHDVSIAPSGDHSKLSVYHKH